MVETFVDDNGVWHLHDGGSASDRLAVDRPGRLSLGLPAGTPAHRILDVEGGEIHTGGVRGGFSFSDRSAPAFLDDPGSSGSRLVWYAQDGSARLWSGGDLLTARRTADGATLGLEGSLSCRTLVSGAAEIRGNVIVDGALDLRDAGGGTDTDVILIRRNSRAADFNDLQLVIGDNLGGDDRLVLGPVPFGETAIREQVVIDNQGNVRAQGQISAGNGVAVSGGAQVGGRVVLGEVPGQTCGTIEAHTWRADHFVGNKLFLRAAAGTASGVHVQIGDKDIAGFFNSNIMIADDVEFFATRKSFRIPHPLHADLVLTHGCPEGPEFAVYYRGEGRLRDGCGRGERAILRPDGRRSVNGSGVLLGGHGCPRRCRPPGGRDFEHQGPWHVLSRRTADEPSSRLMSPEVRPPRQRG